MVSKTSEERLAKSGELTAIVISSTLFASRSPLKFYEIKFKLCVESSVTSANVTMDWSWW